MLDGLLQTDTTKKQQGNKLTETIGLENIHETVYL